MMEVKELGWLVNMTKEGSGVWKIQSYWDEDIN